MKKINQFFAAGIAVFMILFVVFLAFNATVPAFSTGALTALLAPTSSPVPVPGPAIPLKSIAGLTSLNATVTLNVNGLIDGKPVQGDLTALLTTNDQKKKQG